jgi:hypothetical protein
MIARAKTGDRAGTRDTQPRSQDQECLSAGDKHGFTPCPLALHRYLVLLCRATPCGCGSPSSRSWDEMQEMHIRSLLLCVD